MLLIPGPVQPGLLERIKPADSRLLLNLLIATLIVVAVFVMATGAQQVKDRWYQPLLFYAPLIIAMLAMPGKARLNWYLGLGVAFAVLVTVGLVGRTTFAGRFDKYSRPNIPYPDMIASMADRNWKPAFILAETNVLGGNSRPVFPDAAIQVPSYRIDSGSLSGAGLVVCETPDCDNEKFREWLDSNYAIDARSLKFDKIEMPYRYAPAQMASLYFSRVSMSP